MHVVRFAAVIHLVNLDNAQKLRELLVPHCRADTMTHIPCGLFLLTADDPFHVKRANALLCVEHEMGHNEPITERPLGILKDCPADNAKSVAVATATVSRFANPVERTMSDVEDFGVAAFGTTDAIRPTLLRQIGFAGFCRRALVVVKLRLFASACTPHYHVVVGETQDEATTKRLIKTASQLRPVDSVARVV